MKTPFFPTVLTIMLFCMMLFMSCHQEQVQQFTVDLQNVDGSKESYAMVAGSMLLVNDGDMHVVAKAVGGNKSELELQLTRYTVSLDSIKSKHIIRRASANTEKISMAKKALLDPTGTVQVTLQSVAMINTGRQPRGACKGNCCEAKCFSMSCCTDPDECKNVPCDCKPPSNCPVPPQDPQPAHFFELFLSGKDFMVFKI